MSARRESLTVALADFDVFVEIDGLGPWLVMTHGLGTNSNVFAPLAARFSSDHTVVRLDWPGCGRSSLSKSGRALTLPILTGLLLEVMRHLGIRDAVLVGHSLGAIVSTMVAATAVQSSPDSVHARGNVQGVKVRGLVLLASGLSRAADSPARRATLLQASQARRLGIASMVDQRVDVNIPDRTRLLERALLRSATMAASDEGYAQICEALCDQSHVDPDHGVLKIPVVVVGGRHDVISTVAMADQLVERLGRGGRAPRRVILDTGHMMILEAVGETEQAIRSVL